MNSIDQRFEELRAKGQQAFMPFVTAGDPSLEFTEQLIHALDQAGCSLCELGIPYSDPIADGPVIQASYTRALENRVAVHDIFSMTSRLRDKISMPLVAMASYAILFRHRLENFIESALDAGISGAIIPDLLVEDAERLRPTFDRFDFKLIPLITPTTSRERALRIAKVATGFIYYVSVTGITGERTELPPQLVDQLNWLRAQVSLPVCVGFGIGTPEQAKQLAPVCDGVIVGSAIVRRVETIHQTSQQDVIDEVSRFAGEVIAAIRS